ncbi:MAG: hypothetical protein KIT22_10135 [Verrucomicrobiae bacterium]|nr:hypothetical protein [Verrucomicrobiae bacterium]
MGGDFNLTMRRVDREAEIQAALLILEIALEQTLEQFSALPAKRQAFALSIMEAAIRMVDRMAHTPKP